MNTFREVLSDPVCAIKCFSEPKIGARRGPTVLSSVANPGVLIGSGSSFWNEVGLGSGFLNMDGSGF